MRNAGYITSIEQMAIEKEQQTIDLTMLQENMPIEVIARMTHLSPADL